MSVIYGSVFITGIVSAHMAHDKYSDICLLANWMNKQIYSLKRGVGQNSIIILKLNSEWDIYIINLWD